MSYNDKLKGHRYVLAHEDEAFLASDACRSDRMKLEYDRVEYVLRTNGINSTAVIFGSARTPEDHPDYKAAQAVAALISLNSTDGENVIVTGGGPGIMEAANKGASMVHSRNIGLNIELPFEQCHNPYSTPELTFNMKYFSTRKFHLVLRCNAVVAFPGGLGTMDEIYEVLTLKQVGILQDIPVVLYNKSFWNDIFPIDKMLEYGTISESDKQLYAICDDPEETWNYIDNYKKED